MCDALTFVKKNGLLLGLLLPLGSCGVSEMPAVKEKLAIKGDGMAEGQIEVDAKLKRLIESAKKDLAGRLVQSGIETESISPEKIEVVRADAVTWPDSSFGCPRPNTQYMQVLSAGFRILLRYKNTSYAYHSGSDQAVFYCENPSTHQAPNPAV